MFSWLFGNNDSPDDDGDDDPKLNGDGDDDDFKLESVSDIVSGIENRVDWRMYRQYSETCYDPEYPDNFNDHFDDNFDDGFDDGFYN